MSPARLVWPALLLLASCPVPKSPGFFCGEADLDVGDASSDGDVEFSAILTQSDEETAAVTLGWSDDAGETWHIATVEGQTTELAANADGAEYPFVWHSAEDLGHGSWEELDLRLVASSACGAWKDDTDTVAIDNSSVSDTCEVAITTPDSPSDGEITFQVNLKQTLEMPAFLQPEYSVDNGDTWAPMTLVPADCDGDGEEDGIANLSTSNDGEDHCFVWDSQTDFASDEDVLVSVGCGVGYSVEGTAVTDAFTVENDPLPDPEEIIFTELLPDASAPNGEYFEIYNRTGHILNLDGAEIKRSSSSTTQTITLDDPADSLLIYPGQYMLLAGSEDEEENGCLEPDIVWTTTFSLPSKGTLQLNVDGSVIAKLDYEDGWTFGEDVSKGLDPEEVDGNGWDQVANWCVAKTKIEECEAYTSSGGSTTKGTPGAVNDACGGG